MVGTCIALFMLALIERWIAACRGVMEFHWGQQYVLSLPFHGIFLMNAQGDYHYVG
jgi:hypothetical protein